MWELNLGIVVDPDVDRLALVAENGEMFVKFTLVAVADYVLKHTPGNTVSNLSSSRALRDVTLAHGQQYNAAAVGEVNVVTKMKETNTVIGGEGNGGVIYPESHYGRDALVGVGLFLSHFVAEGKSMTALKATYPQYFISKNKLTLSPDMDVDKILEGLKKKYASEEITDIDGVKIDFKDGWVHLKINTEPIIRIYSESKNEAAANQLAEDVIKVAKVCIDEKRVCQSYFGFKAPPSLCTTSSINRGGAGALHEEQGVFKLSSVYRGSTPRGRSLRK